MNEFKDLDFENMTPEQLQAFRAQFNPDEMGSDDNEGADE